MKTLIEYLKATGTRQSALADAVGVSKGHMSEIVHRSRTPSLDVALKIVAQTGGAVAIETLVATNKRMSA